MPTKVAEASSTAEASSVADAVDEAIRTVSGVPHRGADQVKHVMSTSNSLMSEQFATGRHLYQALSEGLQSMLKASFEAQNTLFGTAPALLEAAYTANKAMLGTNPSTLDAIYTASKTMLDRVPSVMHQYQKAMLAAVQETSASTEKLITPPAKEPTTHA
jgi:hypothetical protein